MKFSISVNIGVGKTMCEDTAFINKHLLNDATFKRVVEDVAVFGLCDGVGGNAGGKDASSYVAQSISRKTFSTLDAVGIREYFETLNNELIHNASTHAEKACMATTLSCMVKGQDGWYLVHAGNTRLYAGLSGYLKQITDDHTTYNWLLAAGHYEAAEACNKSEISCCFGGGSDSYLQRLVVERVFEEELPNLLVLTSDGVHEYVDIDTLEEQLGRECSDSEIATTIVSIARQNGSSDDASVMIIRDV